MNVPLVSVIIPVYNVKPYLVESLESVVGQSYRNLEIIVVDDGSTDGSTAICDEYAEKDKRIRVIHQMNKGLSAARNIGLDHMTGEIIAFLDSDDVFHPEMIGRMVDVMFSIDADIVVCKSKSYRTVGKMPIDSILPDTNQHRVVLDRAYALRALIDRTISWRAWDKIYRKKCFESIRYPAGHVYEDVDTTYRIFDVSEWIAMLNESLVMHRKRFGSITEEFAVSSAKDRDLAYHHVSEFVDKNTPEIFTEAHRQKIHETNLSGMLGTYARCGKDASSYRNTVLEAATEVDIRKCSIQTRGKYFLFRHCPRFYVLIHKPLRIIKRRIRMIQCGV